jgi:hypothetical protein
VLFVDSVVRRGTWGLTGAGRIERSAADGKGMRQMFKKSVSILVLASFLSLVIYSCGGDTSTRPGSASPGADDLGPLGEQLGRAPEVRELIAIRDEIVSRALDRGITSEQLQRAVGDSRRSNELLGLSGPEASKLQGRIETLIGSLYGKYPVLEQLVAQEATRAECGACDMNRLAASWDSYSQTLAAARAAGAAPGLASNAWGGAGSSLSPARAPLVCKWTQLTVGFVLCAIKSGGSLFFYALCSYGVFCGSCDGGAADVICG